MGEDDKPEDEEEETSDRNVVVRDSETGEVIEDAEVHIRPKDSDEDDEE